MLGSELWKPDADGTYFIDVSSTAFEHVLKLLREPDNKAAVDTLTYYEKKRLNEALGFLQLPLLCLGWRDIATWAVVEIDCRQLLGRPNDDMSVCISAADTLVVSGGLDRNVPSVGRDLWSRHCYSIRAYWDHMERLSLRGQEHYRLWFRGQDRASVGRRLRQLQSHPLGTHRRCELRVPLYRRLSYLLGRLCPFGAYLGCCYFYLYRCPGGA